MFDGLVSGGTIYSNLKTLHQYFVAAGAPSVYVVPNFSSFCFDGPGSEGLEQGEGFFIGTYSSVCPHLKAEYVYAVYTTCFSTTFLDIPYESVSADVSHRIRPNHWVSFLILR